MGDAADSDRLGRLVALKERELHEVTQLRVGAVEEALVATRALLATEREKFAALKRDFEYNLRLIEERDAELERYDAAFAGLREAITSRDAEISTLQVSLDRAGEEIARERLAAREQRACDAERTETLRRQLDSAHAAAEEQWAHDRDRLLADARDLRRRIADAEEDLRMQRAEFAGAVEAALAQRDREAAARAGELSAAVARAEDAARRAGREADAARAAATERAEECRQLRADLAAAEDAMRAAERRWADRERALVEEHERALAAVVDAGRAREAQFAASMASARAAAGEELAAAGERAWIAEDRCRVLGGELDARAAENAELRGVVDALRADMARMGSARDAELTLLRERAERAQSETRLRLRENERLVHEAELAAQREGELARRLEGLEVEWERRFEEFRLLTKARRDGVGALLEERVRTLEFELARATKERDEAQRALQARSEEEPTAAEDAGGDLARQNEQLRDVIAAMRAEMERMSLEIGRLSRPQTPARPMSARTSTAGAEVKLRWAEEEERESAHKEPVRRSERDGDALVATLREHLGRAVGDIRRLMREREKLVDINNALRAEIERASARPPAHAPASPPLDPADIRIPSPGSLLSGLAEDHVTAPADYGGPAAVWPPTVEDVARSPSARSVAPRRDLAVEGKQHVFAERPRIFGASGRMTAGQAASRVRATAPPSRRTVRNYNIRDDEA